MNHPAAPEAANEDLMGKAPWAGPAECGSLFRRCSDAWTTAPPVHRNALMIGEDRSCTLEVVEKTYL